MLRVMCGIGLAIVLMLIMAVIVTLSSGGSGLIKKEPSGSSCYRPLRGRHDRPQLEYQTAQNQSAPTLTHDNRAPMRKDRPLRKQGRLRFRSISQSQTAYR